MDREIVWFFGSVQEWQATTVKLRATSKLPAACSWLAVFRSWYNAVNRCESFQSQGHQNMVTAIQQRFFSAHYGLTNHDLETYLAAALSAGGDYADLYFEY